MIEKLIQATVIVRAIFLIPVVVLFVLWCSLVCDTDFLSEERDY